MMKQVSLVFAALASSAFAQTGGGNCKSLQDVVCASDNHKALCAAAIVGEFDKKAMGYNWTFFAPTDEAFVDFKPMSDLNYWNNSDALLSITLYHTVGNMSVYAEDLKCGENVTMGNGMETMTVCEGDKIYQVGAQNMKDAMPEIIMTDIEICNGVVHVIDHVLIPNDPLVDEREPPAGGQGNAASTPSASSPTAMPTAGMAAMPSMTPSPTMMDSMTMGPSMTTEPTMSSTTMEPSMSSMPATPSMSPEPSMSSMPAADSPTGGRSEECSTIGDLACGSPDFQTLCSLLESSGLAATDLSEIGDFTIFAPNEQAFNALSSEMMNELRNDVEALANVLLFHVVMEKALYSDDLECTETIEMGNGEESRTVCQGDGSIFQKGSGNSDNNMPEIVKVDMEMCGGVVHEVNHVLMP